MAFNPEFLCCRHKKKAEHKPTDLHLTVYSSHTMPTLYSHVHVYIVGHHYTGEAWLREEQS